VGRAGREQVVALQFGHQRGGLVCDLVQQVAAGVSSGFWHRDTRACQVLHQLQVERQLLAGKALEQRQHPFAFLSMNKEIAVFDARSNATQRDQRR
jgi:hypothetical protein